MKCTRMRECTDAMEEKEELKRLEQTRKKKKEKKKEHIEAYHARVFTAVCTIEQKRFPF